jgi:TonB family protein
VDAAVDRVLAERERRARRGPAVVSLGAAALLHAGVAALIVLLPRLSPPPPPLDYVAVQVVPAQRLGGERPARHEAPETPRPATPPVPPAPPPPAPPAPQEPPPPARSDDAPVLRQPPPKPPKAAKPKPLPPDTRVDPTTLPKVLPPPRELLARKLGAQTPAPAAPPAAVPGPPGAATGTLTGKAEVGSSITALDNPDFTYDYYIAQLVARIDQNWTRPPVGNGVHAIVSFRIHSDGSITGVTVRQSSSFDAFDLAALRAVQNAAPFPPLPRAYTLNHDSVGVNVTLR